MVAVHFLLLIDPSNQAMARGTEVPSLSKPVTTSWHTDAASTGEAGDMSSGGGKTGHEVAEDEGRRGERRDDD